MTRLNLDKAVTPATPTERCRKLVIDHVRYPRRPQIERSKQLIQSELRWQFVDLITGKAPWPLYLHGPAGVGKTYAALALLDWVPTSHYWTVDALMSKFKYGEAPWQIWWGQPVQLAVLDEVGRPRPGEGKTFDLDMVKLFADWREHRPAIYISNYSPERIANIYDGPVTSRLTCGTVFGLVDVDRRKEVPEWLKSKGA